MAVPPELWPIVCRLATSRPWPPQGDADVAAFFDYAQREKLLALLMADNDLPDHDAGDGAQFAEVHVLELLWRGHPGGREVLEDVGDVRVARHHPGAQVRVPVDRRLPAQTAVERVGIRQDVRVQQLV